MKEISSEENVGVVKISDEVVSVIAAIAAQNRRSYGIPIRCFK